MDKEEVKHWFEMEIALAEERTKLKHNPMFNGVEVGHEKQIELNKAHIRYCEYSIKALCKEESREDVEENNKANENIVSLIDELIGARKCVLRNHCPYVENRNPENDCEYISCEECVEKYFENMRERLLKEYIVK